MKKQDTLYKTSDALWDKLRLLLPIRVNTHRFGGGRPRVVDRQAMDGILFVLRTGCQWKALDKTGICSGSTAHRRFQEWTLAGVFLKLWAMGLEAYDEVKGIDWSWQSMDGTINKAPLGGEKTGSNPTDRAKKGVKRSVLTEAAGVPIALAVEGANRHDCKMAEATLTGLPVKRPEPTMQNPQHLCLDKGYDYKEVRELLETFGYTAHIRARGEEARAIKQEVGFKARRWVVERTGSWMNRFRRILIRWEKKVDNYIGLLHLVCGIITFRCAGLLG